MLLKFCGLRRQEDVTLGTRLGATHCGFVFHAGSPRCVDAVTVSRLESGDMVRVGVFTGQDSDEIARIMRLARLDMAQLHARPVRGLCPSAGGGAGDPGAVAATVW